jgi:hypothetical protein
MNNAIHQLPSIDQQIKINPIYTPKQPINLISLGSNDISKKINFASVTSSDEFKNYLTINLEQKNKIGDYVKKEYKIKDFNITSGEFLEIYSIFGFNNITNIVTSHDNIFSSKKLSIHDFKAKESKCIVFFKYSDFELNENSAAIIILSELHKLLSKQLKGSYMILQVFNIQTQFMVELIYYLTSLYQIAYIYKPSITSNISPSKYLILMDLKEKTEPPKFKVEKDSFLHTLGVTLDKNFTEIIQCVNVYHHTELIKNYLKLQYFLDKNAYDEILRGEMLDKQDKNADEWIKMFASGKDNDLLLKYLKNTENECNYMDQLLKIYG